MRFSAVLRRERKAYVAWCPELDVASQGPTIESAMENLKEACELRLAGEDRIPAGATPLVTTFEVHHAKAAHPVGA